MSRWVGKKCGFKNIPLFLYIIETDVQDEQLDAIVGNVKTGLPVISASVLTVSVAFPPPIANNISAFLTVSSDIRFSTFS